MFSQDLDTKSNSKVIIKLFQNVKNVPEIRQKIISSSLKCCVIKPSLITDPLQVIVAANKAVCAQKLKTKSIYSEILFNLSISKNITQSLQTFGIHDKETDLLVVVITNDIDNSEEVFKEIDGDETDVIKLQDLCDTKALCKAYKIGDEEFKCVDLIDSVVTRIAVKDCLL
ncbi:EKC/KEOPS complex subunit TPRKB-like [Onthophagus taurus]|uniref:EKC/KEOPS complex subunit TPRKB-like n=1 Tax=Onthophagus taurus TaxID=166361 RepID=UPI000C201F86|nr:EKC/KEOPS complex subunit Tprkb-like [Onthophagus taurus]